LTCSPLAKAARMWSSASCLAAIRSGVTSITTSARMRRTASTESSRTGRPHDSIEPPASAARTALRRSTPLALSTLPWCAVRIPTTAGSRPWSRASAPRLSTRRRANSRPTLPNPTRRRRRRVRPTSHVEDLAHAAPERGVHDDVRHSGVLDADPGQVRDRDLVVPLATRLHAGGDLAELRVDVLAPHHAGLDRVMDFAEPRALVEAVRDDLVGLPEHADVELPLLRAVGADRGDVHPGPHPVRAHERLARRRHGDDEIGPADGLLHGLRREDLHPVTVRDLSRVGRRLRLRATVGDHAFRRLYPEECRDLVPRLRAHSDDPDALDVPPREQVGRKGACGPRPDLREISVVDQDGPRGPRRRVEDEDRPAPGRP